jgi:uncharacterized protein YutE (UPF0331/DUF86 family)
LQVILRNLRQLEDIRGIGFEKYCQGWLERKAAERLLQELVEAATDVNVHILSSLDHGVPEENYRTFIELGTCKVIDSELARKLAPATGLRNRLVHEYNEIADEKVWEAIGEAEKLFPHYLKAVEEFLEHD